MEAPELYIEPILINPANGQFRKNHIPFNKGKKMINWMDGRKIRKVKKYLEIGRINGNPNLPGHNKKPIVGIKDGKLIAFSCAGAAERFLKAKGIRVNRRNINIVCHHKMVKGYKGNYYGRERAGGYRWFFESDIDKWAKYIVND